MDSWPGSCSSPVDLMVMHLSCSSCLVSVSLASPACIDYGFKRTGSTFAHLGEHLHDPHQHNT